MRITTPARMATSFLLAAATASEAARAVIDIPVTPLIVRIYGAQALPPPQDQSALREARAILAQAGLAPEWVPCASGASAARCAIPLGNAELVVRVVTAPPQPYSARPLPLGYSLVDARTRSGSLATIYLDRVQWLAAASTTDVAALLGRAIAHEIGHLLLGTPHHAPFGVMRAIWSRQLVRHSRPNEWRFSVHEAKQMRAAVTARIAAGRLAHVSGEDASTHGARALRPRR